MRSIQDVTYSTAGSTPQRPAGVIKVWVVQDPEGEVTHVYDGPPPRWHAAEGAWITRLILEHAEPGDEA